MRDQLDDVPIEAWEAEFPIIDMCLRDSLRLNLLGTAFRRNISSKGIPTGNGNEVIPPALSSRMPLAISISTRTCILILTNGIQLDTRQSAPRTRRRRRMALSVGDQDDIPAWACASLNWSRISSPHTLSRRSTSHLKMRVAKHSVSPL